MMIPYFLDNFKIIKIEKKQTENSIFPARNSKGHEELVATVKMYFLDADGDQTNKTIRVSFFGNQQLTKSLPDKGKFNNLRVGCYKDNFYFKADSLIIE